MAIADVNAEYLGVKRVLLMENAGRGLSDLIWEVFTSSSSTSIIIFAGKGGNGGDGMVAARHLAEKADIFFYLLGSSTSIKKKSTKQNWKILENMSQSLKIYQLDNFGEVNNLKKIDKAVIVDAIFGTGIKGEIGGLYKECIEFINSSQQKGAKVVSVDTPSGIDPNTGKSANIFVNPDRMCEE